MKNEDRIHLGGANSIGYGQQHPGDEGLTGFHAIGA
jgi:hypothetical protein